MDSAEEGWVRAAWVPVVWVPVVWALGRVESERVWGLAVEPVSVPGS